MDRIEDDIGNAEQLREVQLRAQRIIEHMKKGKVSLK